MAAGKTGELIAVTNVSGTTWTVTRGAESTTPVAHSAGFTIYQVVSAGGYAQLASVDWLNAVTQFGADNTGATDPPRRPTTPCPRCRPAAGACTCPPAPTRSMVHPLSP